MSLSALEDQLRVTVQLLKELRKSYPNCLLIPFGSVISGLATKHSDCDLCLVPSPPASLVQLLTGTSYFSPSLHSMVKQLEKTYGVTMCPPAMPPSAPTTSSWEESFSSSFNLSRSERGATFAPLLKKICAHLHQMKGCGQVRSIPHARCPIVRFVHRRTSFHFDICIDNM